MTEQSKKIAAKAAWEARSVIPQHAEASIGSAASITHWTNSKVYGDKPYKTWRTLGIMF